MNKGFNVSRMRFSLSSKFLLCSSSLRKVSFVFSLSDWQACNCSLTAWQSLCSTCSAS